MTVDSRNNLYALDDAGRVLIYSSDGTLVKQWDMPDVTIGRPEGICILKDGRVAVADTHYNRIVIFSPEGKVSKIFGKKGDAEGELCNPVGIAEDDAGNLLVCEYGDRHRVQRFTPDGKYLSSFGQLGEGDGEFQRPSGIVWYEGNIYVADAVNNRVQVFDRNGAFLKTFDGDDGTGKRFYLPYDISIGDDGFVYVVEYGNGCIAKLSRDGKLVGRYGRVGSGRGEFKTPWGLTVDHQLRVFVADTGNRRLVVLEK